MTLSPLIRPDTAVLAQYLVMCPGCRQPAAAHVDTSADLPVLVRFVCPEACVVDEGAVLSGLAQAGRPETLTISPAAALA
jgi:hypothetical protein